VTEPRDIADLVREIRLRLDLTQEEFASKLGVTFPTVNRWENRRSKPSRMALKLIEGMVQQMGAKDLLTKYF
jgi:DNA-binding transcriptional regulator YiaG